MSRILNLPLLFVSLSLGALSAKAADNEKVLFKDLVSPILNAKCGSCHGADKQKGKLRLDTIEAIMKGGSEGVSVVAGKPAESSLIGRSKLPLDDDEHMPPESKPQLTKEELAVVEFWVQSGANPTATIAALKPSAEVDAMIKVVIANPPKGAAATAVAKVDPAKLKIAEETIGNVEKTGASLMAIAQDTPDLRFSALNVAREYNDKNLEVLKPVADQVKWMDLARTQVTDGGLAHVAGMKNLTRLHLENTKITDAGLEHLKGLANLEYLNLYGTAVTDAGLAKLAGLKNLKKLFVWQTKVTDAGAKKIGAAIPGITVNTGWKEPPAPKPVVVAKTTPAKPAPATKKPVPAPAPAPKKPAPAPKKAASASGVPALDKAVAELKLAVAETAKLSAAAAKTSTDTEAAAKKAAADATAAKAASDKAAMIAGEAKTALEMLEKLAKLSPGTYDKALAELKAGNQKANAAAAAAAKKATDAAAASKAAEGKIAGVKAAAAKAGALAQQTKAALDILVKATAG